MRINRDRTRSPGAKARTVRRRQDRRTASALRFLALLDDRRPFGAL